MTKRNLEKDWQLVEKHSTNLPPEIKEILMHYMNKTQTLEEQLLELAVFVWEKFSAKQGSKRISNGLPIVDWVSDILLQYNKIDENGLFWWEINTKTDNTDEPPKIIEWDSYGYPTDHSLQRLRHMLRSNDYKQMIKTFYMALKENYFPGYCGYECIEVRGEVIDVWAYHTGGWGGNESIISVLKECILFHWFLERYDRGGHYYFKPLEKALPM